VRPVPLNHFCEYCVQRRSQGFENGGPYERELWGLGVLPAVGSRGKASGRGQGKKPPEAGNILKLEVYIILKEVVINFAKIRKYN